MSAQQTIKRADAYAASYEPTGDNPDLDSRVAVYKALDDSRDAVRHVHARTLMAVVDRLPAGDQAEDEGDEVLRGAALDEALEAAGLPKTGSADEKRQRLAEHQASIGG